MILDMPTDRELTIIRLAIDTVVLGVACWGFYWLRRIGKKIREERELIRGLLATVKGWTVVSVESEGHLKATIPEATAAKVVEKLEQRSHDNDTGVVPIAKPPESPVENAP